MLKNRFQVGLLPAGNEESVAMAYSVYSRKADTVLVEGRETLAQGFKRTFSRDVYCHFVGVWCAELPCHISLSSKL